MFDLVVIGSGPAGYAAAVKARRFGLGVCLVEKAETGGTCLNRGCIPTKAILHSAGLYREMRESHLFGVNANDVSFDWNAVLARKTEVVDGIRRNQEAFIEKSGIVLEKGCACVDSATGGVFTNGIFTSGAFGISINGKDGRKTIEAKNVLIATGTKPARIPVAGSALPGVITSDNLLAGNATGAIPQRLTIDGGGVIGADNATFPHRLTIIGGGVIGMEFAAAFSSFGTQVTVIEALPRVLANMDREISQNLAMILKKRGVTIITGASLDRIEETGGGSDGGSSDGISAALRCFYKKADTALETAVSDTILMATGRKADTAGLFADGVKVKLTEKGFIAVDKANMTNIPGLYAAGDITGGIQLAHAATAYGERVAEYIATQSGIPAGRPTQAEGAAPIGAIARVGAVPSCVYTTPEIASVGITADEAKERGIPVITGKGIFGSNGKAVIENQERGFIKLVFHAETKALVGCQMMCNRATDMIAWAVQGIDAGITVGQIQSGIFAHPTYAETIAMAAAEIS
jgi:dihydrolipoamide dehydrogenase